LPLFVSVKAANSYVYAILFLKTYVYAKMTLEGVSMDNFFV